MLTTGSTEDLRVAQLDELAITDGSLGPIVAQVCRLAGTLFGVPMSFMSIIDATTQHLVAYHGLQGCSVPRADGICDIAIRGDAPLVIEDTLMDPRVSRNPFVVDEPRMRFYVGVPLALTSGMPLGAFCIADTAPRRFSAAEISTLVGLADIVADQLRHRASTGKLARQTLDLEWTATRDPLTRLWNRASMTRHIEAAIRSDDTHGEGVALIVLDIDRFKMVNDSLGQTAGDAVLLAVAERLTSTVGERGLAARIGGDEFAVLLTACPTTGTIAALTTDILLRLRQPVRFDGADLDARVTMGVAVRSPATTCASDLFKEADIAFSNARMTGRDGFAFYSPAMSEALTSRLITIATARTAVFAGQIEPYYQPKVCLKTQEIVGFEALLRWHHPTLGLSGPDAMGDVFSDHDIAKAIGRGMLRRVAADMVQWTDLNLPFGHVAINVAEPEFHTGDYADEVLACLAAHGLTPAMLEVEVTESVFLGQRSGVVARTMQKLCAAGISIALDDFGTGYASLTHLKQYPVGSIKIDRSFVADIETNTNAAMIIEAVTSLANSLKIGLVAEGIETPAQLAFLRDRRCAIGQGYLFARPMAASRVPHFMHNWTASRAAQNLRIPSR